MSLYVFIMRFNDPSAMSRWGIQGKKSLPTKKHMNTKSSMMRSRSKPAVHAGPSMILPAGYIVYIVYIVYIGVYSIYSVYVSVLVC
jgi:hypothetical protein